jgi:hypothetical protein
MDRLSELLEEINLLTDAEKKELLAKWKEINTDSKISCA